MFLRTRTLAPLAALILSHTALAAEPTASDDAARIDFFEKRVRPVLVEHCYNCHSATTNSRGGLRVDDRNGLIRGGGSGPAIVPGKPEKSLLIEAINHSDDLKMPPKKQLAPEQIADITRWIKDGAAWPKVEFTVSTSKVSANYDKLRKEHWAWQPLKPANPPTVKDTAWGRADIDRFILAPLEAKGIKPVADADRVSLIRRVTFDLVGLPPTPEEIQAFAQDTSADAFAKVVDRLLASPAFGEHWGRHWLDVARYGESTGSARNVPYPHAWRYRDYVIDSFNADKPYDQFLREQIAGDLLPAKSPKQRDEQLIATGFLALGVKDVNQRFKVRFIMDNIDEQIDTVSRAVLGLTASCARCHDHKFDPIPQADYYALAGIFHSTDLCAGVRNKMGGGGLDYYDHTMLLPLENVPAGKGPDANQIVAATKALAEAKADLESVRGKPEGRVVGSDGRTRQQAAQQKMVRLQNELLGLTDPAARGQVALGVRDSKTIGDTELRIRGEAEKLGPVVPRGFLSVVPVADAPKVAGDHSGRLELAQWLTSTKNPLTPRVMANRVWHHLFGAGLVPSVDNFGVTGEKPSHPELLDYLATRLVRDDWSVKKLVRAVVLSRAYQLGSDVPKPNVAADAANRLVWRHNPRRLTAEELRDATLAATGTLDRSRPASAPVKDLKVMEMRNDGPEANKMTEAARSSKHRSVYLPLVRTVVPTSLEVFDAAEQGMVTGSRDSTTVAPQALYLLNDPFIRGQSQTLAARLLGRKDLDDAGRIDAAYRLTLGRAPLAKEAARVAEYLADFEAETRETTASKDAKIQSGDPKTAAWSSFCQALFASAEFRYLR